MSNIARTVFEFCDQRVHPFLFEARVANKSLPTSVTSTRAMTIDYLLVQAGISILETKPLPDLDTDHPIPSEVFPSDHLPLCCEVAFQSGDAQLRELVRGWASVLLADGAPTDGAPAATAPAAGAPADGGAAFVAPLTAEQVRRAFTFLAASAGTSALSPPMLVEGVAAAGGFCTQRLDGLLPSVEAALGRRLSADVPLSGADFSEAYVRAFVAHKGVFREEMRLAFSHFDTDGSGFLEYDELRASFRAASPFPVSDAMFAAIWGRIDANRDGAISIDEFVDHLITRRHRVLAPPHE